MIRVSKVINIKNVAVIAKFEKKSFVKMYFGQMGIKLSGTVPKEIFNEFSQEFHKVYNVWKVLDASRKATPEDLAVKTLESWKKLSIKF